MTSIHKQISQNQQQSNNISVSFAGLTLKQYFQQTQQLQLKQIEEEQSQSQLQYRQPKKENAKRHLHSLTRLKQYEIDLQKTLPKTKVDKVANIPLSKKYSFNQEQAEPIRTHRLPKINPKSYSPQLKNIKLEILNKFRQNNRVKTEVQDSCTCKSREMRNVPFPIHITKKKIMLKSNKSNKTQRADIEDAFLLTFQKKNKKMSEIDIHSNRIKHNQI